MPNRRIYVSILISYLNLLTYFYITFYTSFLLNFIINGYQLKFIIVYNIYIKQLPRNNVAFLAKS